MKNDSVHVWDKGSACGSLQQHLQESNLLFSSHPPCPFPEREQMRTGCGIRPGSGGTVDSNARSKTIHLISFSSWIGHETKQAVIRKNNSIFANSKTAHGLRSSTIPLKATIPFQGRF